APHNISFFHGYIVPSDSLIAVANKFYSSRNMDIRLIWAITESYTLIVDGHARIGHSVWISTFPSLRFESVKRNRPKLIVTVPKIHKQIFTFYFVCRYGYLIPLAYDTSPVFIGILLPNRIHFVHCLTICICLTNTRRVLSLRNRIFYQTPDTI